MSEHNFTELNDLPPDSARENHEITEVEAAPEPEQPEGYKPFKVFINHVDSYHSKYISSLLADQIYGLSRIVPTGAQEEAPGEESPVPEAPVQLPTDKYQLIGTLSAVYKKPTEDIKSVVHEDDDNFIEEILNCGFIIYDITRDSNEISKALKALQILTEQLEEIKKVGPKTYENFPETKIFILISTVMTWARTKPLDPDDPDLPFSEVDYRKRRPHPNYKEHYTCEKEVIKIGQNYKDKLKTYVVCCGNTYGEEEDDLEFFFKMAWYNEVLPIFNTGNNTVPFIHVKDLAKALHSLMENAPPKPQYVLAVEQTPTTLKQFIKTLSKALSDGKTKNVIAEEAFLYPNMTQILFDKCTVNLTMEPVFFVENLQIEWQSDSNIAENMIKIVNEFKNARNLKPVKIILHGPPASGKTKLANKLCEYYNSKYISTESMLQDFISIWKENMNRPEKPPLEETENLGEEEVEEVEEEEDPAQLLESIREAEILMEGGIEKMPDDYIIGLLKTYLGKNFCQNRGYTLDGFPQTTPQAKELFGFSQNPAGEEEEAEVGLDGDKILPDLVVSLVASDEVICKRLMELKEEEIRDTPYAEDVIVQRLEDFRQNNTEDDTVLNYFDELEIDILLIELESPDYEQEFRIVAQKLGIPSSFGLSEDEELELYNIEQQQKKMELEMEALKAKMFFEEAEEIRKNKMEEWAETFEKLQLEEEKILIAQSEPLRHYLMKYVFPVLTKGLIEVAKIKPDDPVDFLAEYLFKENPEGKMFDPSYNAECEGLYNEFRGYIEKVINENEAFDK